MIDLTFFTPVYIVRLFISVLLLDTVLIDCQANYTYTNFNATNFTSGQIHAAQDFLLNNYVMESVVEGTTSPDNIICYVANTPLDTLAFVPECTDSGAPSVREHLDGILEKAKESLKDDL